MNTGQPKTSGKPKTSGQPKTRDASSRFIWPPVIYTSACLAAWLLSWTVQQAFAPAAIAKGLGWVLVILGGGVASWAELAFLLAGTATLPISSTSKIVTTGIYRWTRNPMYLGMSLFTAGLAFLLDSAWFLIVLPIAVYAVTKLAIEPEEAYLERKFGQQYLAYKSAVRRWV